MRRRLAYSGLLAALLCGSVVPAIANASDQREVCRRWAAKHSYPSGIEQERCRSAFPDLASDYGAYCSRVEDRADTDKLTRAACLSYRDAQRRG